MSEFEYSIGFDDEFENIVASLQSIEAEVPLSACSQNLQVNLEKHDTYPDYRIFAIDPDTQGPLSSPVGISTEITTPSLSARVPFTPTASTNNCRIDTVPSIPVPDLLEVTGMVPRIAKTGEFNFSVVIDENNGTKWKFMEEEKYLFIKKDVFVPITFKTSEPLPFNSLVRITSVYTLLEDFNNMGTVKNTIDKKRFVMSSGPAAEYSHYRGDDCILLRIGDLHSSDTGPFGVISFTCTSSQLNVGTNRKALPLLLLFSLIVDGEEVGLDVVNLKVCCGIKRDSMRVCAKRTLPSTDTPPSQSHSAPAADNKKRKIEPNLSNILEGYTPDQDGKFTFTWRGSDIQLLKLFVLVKKGYELGETN